MSNNTDWQDFTPKQVLQAFFEAMSAIETLENKLEKIKDLAGTIS